MRMIKSGTRVRLKVATMNGNKGVGTLMEDAIGDGSIHVMLDSGPTLCARHEISVLRDQTPGPEPMRYRLPYGKWTCPDGREVLFNRDYKPIWQRRPGEPPNAADREEWVRFDRQEWLYGDHNPPWRDKGSLARCEGALAGWGVGP